MARAEEIPDEEFFEALHANVGRSGLADLKEGKLRARDYAPQFALKHMAKDLRLALETAESLDLTGAKSLKLLYDKGMRSGLADEDFSALIRLVDHTK